MAFNGVAVSNEVHTYIKRAMLILTYKLFCIFCFPLTERSTELPLFVLTHTHQIDYLLTLA
jgi:hypothetical protein